MIKRLLCTDLDRTLIPNGAQPESPRAQELFDRLARRPELTLVYVTGRHRQLIEQAIVEYRLPRPAFAIADVGTTIYQLSTDTWTLLHDWQEHLREVWPQDRAQWLRDRLQLIAELTPQEVDKQGCFKMSYYARNCANVGQTIDQLLQIVHEQADACHLQANLIWSIDSVTGLGLLDILPIRANKLTAILFLQARLGIETRDILFAGDSGNDRDVFRSHLPCVVVANAEPEIIEWARRADRDQLYVATGCLPELNGNYRAGILEGACHFWPEAYAWIKDP